MSKTKALAGLLVLGLGALALSKALAPKPIKLEKGACYVATTKSSEGKDVHLAVAVLELAKVPSPEGKEVEAAVIQLVDLDAKAGGILMVEASSLEANLNKDHAKKVDCQSLEPAKE